MLGAILNKLVRILPLVTEAEASSQSCPTGETTSVVTSLPTIHGRELVTMVSSDQNVTLVKRFKGGSQNISVDRSQVVVGGTDLMDRDTGGLGQEVELLITNASASAATVTIWAAVRM